MGRPPAPTASVLNGVLRGPVPKMFLPHNFRGVAMPTNAKKTLTDAGYIAVGLGVLGFQQAQTRARTARERVTGVGGCLAGRAREARSALDSQRHAARTQAETQVRNTVARAGALRD